MEQRPQTGLERELEAFIYTDRLLVVLEHPEGFRQIRLTKAQFKKVSNAVCRSIGPKDEKGIQDVQVSLGKEVIPKKAFGEMQDFYDR